MIDQDTWRLILTIVALVLIWRGWRYWYELSGRSFWKIVARHPDLAFDWFRQEPGWMIVGIDEHDPPGEPQPRGEYSGPYWLAVPKLNGKMIKIYAHHSILDDSQRRFVEASKAW